MSEEHQTTLLAQRIDQLERENSDLKDQIRTAVASINKAEGRSGIMSAAIPLLIAVGGMIFGTVIYSSQQATSNTATANTIEIAKIEHRVTSAFTEINDVRVRKIKHEDLHGHPGTTEQVATIHERLKMTESQILTMTEEDKLSRGDRTKLSGLVERTMLLISQNSSDIEKNELKASTNERAISSMASSVEGHLREVETQIRSLNEVYNVRWQGMRSILAIIYRKAMGDELPEEDFYPKSIPATATSELGKIQTNGN